MREIMRAIFLAEGRVGLKPPSGQHHQSVAAGDIPGRGSGWIETRAGKAMINGKRCDIPGRGSGWIETYLYVYKHNIS